MKLWVVGTPLGNLQDISVRALETLRSIRLIIAEDTRRSVKLINHFSLGEKELISLPQPKMKEKMPFVIQRLQHYQQGAYLTDAGMPGIGDPVADLINDCHRSGISIDILPGPSAPTTAYSVSGFHGSFIFEGFLPRDKKRRRFFRELTMEKRNLVFFESPYRLVNCLSDALTILGNRQVCIARELTKLHQELFWGNLHEAITHFKEPKGEFTVVMEGARQDESL